MIPSGPDPKPAFTKGFFELAMEQNPKPHARSRSWPPTQEFSANASDGALENAKAREVSTSSTTGAIRPTTTDFAPIVRAIAATNPDIVVVCSYPPDSVGIVRAVNEIGFKPKMIGGAMVGPQNTVDQGAARPAAQRLDQL